MRPEEEMFTDYDGSVSYADEYELDDTCDATYVTGGNDPYSTTCELDRGHDGPHEGDDPFGDNGRVRWNGGGSITGDAVPYRDVEWIDKPRRLTDLEEGELPLSEPIEW